MALREHSYKKSFVKKIYPAIIQGLQWSAIQVSTAAGLCVMVDLVINQFKEYKGLVLQENFSLDQVLANRFGKYFA